VAAIEQIRLAVITLINATYDKQSLFNEATTRRTSSVAVDERRRATNDIRGDIRHAERHIAVAFVDVATLSPRRQQQ